MRARLCSNARQLRRRPGRILALAIRLHLEAEGFDVDTAGDGDAALVSARTGRFDVILLDLRLPKRDGTDVLRAIRERGDRTPVLCVTARAEERAVWVRTTTRASRSTPLAPASGG